MSTITREIVISKKIDGNIVTVYPQTSSNLVTVGDSTLSNKLKSIDSKINAVASNKGSVPTGTIVIWYGSSTIPDGWLPLDGQAISREAYSDLFSLYGTSFGEGDGSTTFNIPNQNSGVNDAGDTDYKYIVKATNAILNTETSSISAYSLESSENTQSSFKSLNVPIGSVIDYVGTDVPEDWMLTDGRELSISDYPELYSVIGTSFGSSENGKFNIPTITDITDNVHKIIKVNGVNNLVNTITLSEDDVANMELIKKLSDRIAYLESYIGI